MKDLSRPLLATLAVLALMTAGLAMVIPADDSSATIISGSAGQNVTWSFDSSNQTITFSGTGAMYDYYYGQEDHPLRDIGTSIRTVIINSGVTYIGSSIMNPGWGTMNVTSVTIPNTVTAIGESAFNSGKFTSITIPSSVESIGTSAFGQCYDLKTVNLSEGLIFIDSQAFQRTGITSISLPASLLAIQPSAFYESEIENISVSSSSVTYDSVDGVLFSKDHKTLVIYPAGRASIEYVVPANTEIIGDWAFNSSTQLQSIILPNTINQIGEYAFHKCSSLASINIPSSVSVIQKYTFAQTGFTSFSIPNNITSIGPSAFSNCSSLTSVTVPPSVTSLVKDTFRFCSNLETAYVPNTTTVASLAFPTTTNIIRYDPEVSITSNQSDVSILTGSNFSYNVITDPEDATISVSGASWLNVNGHLIYGTVSEPGEYTITVSAYKDGYGVGSQSFTVTVSSGLVFISGPSAGYIVQAGGQ